jgi:S-formylglutathione hydrolase FrmB
MADGGERESMEVRGIHGSIVEGAFYSQALDREMAYQVYLPPSYDGSLRPYPVLYLLHGRGSNRTQWFMSGFTDVADQGILDGTVAPMLIVFPEGAFGYWTNHANNGPRWGDYVAKDLVAHVDATYRTVRRPSARAIGGISMGAWGALHHAFSAPDVYGVVGAHSPALRPDDGTLAFLGRGAEFSGKDPLSLARTLPANSRLRIRIDTGQDDPWVARATLLHNTLTERGIAHAWQVTPGGHNWDYWHALLEEYLRFYTRALTR